MGPTDTQVINYREVPEPPDRSRAVSVLLFLATVLFLGWSALPLLGLDSNRYTAALVALTEYVAAVGIVITLFALLLRRWLTVLLVGLVTTLLVLSVAPRAIPDTPHPIEGSPVRVLSVNTYFGQARAADVVELVRRNQVDVLSLQELTPELVSELDRAGLADLMPHRVFHAQPHAGGTGIASRFPLRELNLVPQTTFAQPSALVDLPGARDLEVVAVHPSTPVADVDRWRADLHALPGPVSSGNPRVLVGDFNATLDHTPMREFLGRGYGDAAAITGDGLKPTWPWATAWFPPPVTLDHVLVSGGVDVQGYQRFPMATSDHRAILAHLVVPS